MAHVCRADITHVATAANDTKLRLHGDHDNKSTVVAQTGSFTVDVASGMPHRTARTGVVCWRAAPAIRNVALYS